MGRVNELTCKGFRMLREDGVLVLISRTSKYLKKILRRQVAKKLKKEKKIFRDVLFVNGCGIDVPHPTRYRVTHQREQLAAYNISTGEVFFEDLDLDLVRYYRTFIFFRCPHTDAVEEFIRLAKELNKKVLFDIDDLVMDTQYTRQIEYLNTLSVAQRKQYDEGVERMGRTLRLCDGAITTTNRLATELKKVVPEVFINRNTASEEMFRLSKVAMEKKVGKPRRSLQGAEVDIGYFSGSITHNNDFLLVLPALLTTLDDYPNVKLHLVGELTLPEELVKFKSRIVLHPFVDWRKLPELIASVDINLAPLEKSIFNEGKSENKWVEAALVKVPTIASNVGAFAEMIQDGETGLLCNTKEEWGQALKLLITDDSVRCRIGERAYAYCAKHCITTYTGWRLSQYIRQVCTPNIAFFMPSFKISGGVIIALKHAEIMQEAGFDVVLLDDQDRMKWVQGKRRNIPVINREKKRLQGRFDKAVATMFTTLEFVEEYQNIGERYYLVQNYETDFYPLGSPYRMIANTSYSPQLPVSFVTISKWCQEWLLEKFGQDANYAPNGIEGADFPHRRRDFSGRVRILIEGDCALAYKNVDEAFEVVKQLDKEKFEIWYLSYTGTTKSEYHVDEFLSQVPHAEVSKIYEQCDMLLKTSILESFSLPPLEMMATGGAVVVVPNGGNAEYLVDGQNCLLYPQGEIEKAVEAIHRICADESLQNTLYENGKRTAMERDWENIKGDIVRLYHDS